MNGSEPEKHSTLAHCRQVCVCLSCFESGHIKRNCPNHNSKQEQAAHLPQGQQPLNQLAHSGGGGRMSEETPKSNSELEQ